MAACDGCMRWEAACDGRVHVVRGRSDGRPQAARGRSEARPVLVFRNLLISPPLP